MRKYYGSMLDSPGEKKPAAQKRLVKKTHLKKSEPTTVTETSRVSDLRTQLLNEEKELAEKMLLSSASSKRESFSKQGNEESGSNFGLQFQKQVLPGTNIMSSDSKFDSNVNIPGERGSMLSRRDLEQKFGQSMRAIVDTKESKDAMERYKAESEKFIREINGSLHRSLERDFLDNMVKPVRLMDMQIPHVADGLTTSQRSFKDLFPQMSYEDMMAKEASPSFYKSIKSDDKTIRASFATLDNNEPVENLFNYNSIQSRESKSDTYSEQEILDRILNGTRKAGDFSKRTQRKPDAIGLVIPPSKLPKLADVSREHDTNQSTPQSESYAHLQSIRDLGAKFTNNKIADSVAKESNNHGNDRNQSDEDEEIPQFKKSSASHPKPDGSRVSDLPSFTKRDTRNLVDTDDNHQEHSPRQFNGYLESNYNTGNDNEGLNYQTEKQLSVNHYFSTQSNQEAPRSLAIPGTEIQNRPKNRSDSSQYSQLDQSVDPDTLLPSELIDRNIQKKRPLFDNFDRRNDGNFLYDNRFEEPNMLLEEFESESNSKLTILPGVVRNSGIGQPNMSDRKTSRSTNNDMYANSRNKLSFKQADFFATPDGVELSDLRDTQMATQEMLQAISFKKGGQIPMDDYELESNFETEQPKTFDKEMLVRVKVRKESADNEIEAQKILMNVRSETSDRVMTDMHNDSKFKPDFNRQKHPAYESDCHENGDPVDQSSEDTEEPVHQYNDTYDSDTEGMKKSDFEARFNRLIEKTLNAKASIIQRRWLQVAEAKRESVQIDTLFSKFLQLKKSAIKSNKYQIESKVSTQTHNYSIALIAKEFNAHLNSLQKGSPMGQSHLRELLKHLNLLMLKLGIVFEV